MIGACGHTLWQQASLESAAVHFERPKRRSLMQEVMTPYSTDPPSCVSTSVRQHYTLLHTVTWAITAAAQLSAAIPITC